MFHTAAKLLIRTEVISPLWALLATAACPALEVGKINILKRRGKRRRKHAWRILRGKGKEMIIENGETHVVDQG